MNLKRRVFFWVAAFFGWYLLCHIDGYGQVYNLTIDSLTKDYIQQKVQNNNSAYNLRYPGKTMNGIMPDETITLENVFFYDAFLPRPGFEIEMDIKKLSWVYPEEGFTVYQVYIPRITHLNRATGERKRFFDKWTAPYFLVAVNSDLTGIKFLSGQFYIHAFVRDFSVNFEAPDTALQYLKFKLFEYQIEDVHFLRKKKKTLVYRAFSKRLNREVSVKLTKEHVDSPHIEVL